MVLTFTFSNISVGWEQRSCTVRVLQKTATTNDTNPCIHLLEWRTIKLHTHLNLTRSIKTKKNEGGDSTKNISTLKPLDIN